MDLIERLREYEGVSCQPYATMVEAADEIEQLRSSKTLHLKLAEIKQTELERLREALKQIRDWGPMTVDDQRWRIAIAALKGDE